MDNDPLDPGIVRWEDHRADPMKLPDGRTVPLAFLMKPRVHAEGFIRAVARLREAAASRDDVEVHLALFEALAWLSTIEDDPLISGDVDVQAVGLARDRIQHHRAIVFLYPGEDDRAYWQSEKLMPWPPDARYQGRRKIDAYETRLADKPLLEVFDRLEPRVRRLLEVER